MLPITFFCRYAVVQNYVVAPTSMDAEADLIAKCRRADAAAWDEIFDRYYSAAARFIFQLAPDFTFEDAEEVCQETFLAAIRNIGSFKGQSAFQTWLLRIAANKASDYRQKARAEKRGGGLATLSFDNVDEGRSPLQVEASGLSPDASLLSAETAALVRQSLDQLDQPCREIIELRYYADSSYEEIGAALRLHPKTVSSRLSRCLRKLGQIAREVLPRENFDESAV